MSKTLIRPFIHSAGGILLAAALIRFFIATGHSPVLALPDPMLGISLRFALLIAGGIELTFALFCLFGSNIRLQTGLLAWLSTCFMMFWLGLFWMHCHLQGTCLGSLNDPLHLSRGMAGTIMAFMPLYLLLGSYAAMVWLWLEVRRAQAAKFIKMSCPACGNHLRFDGRNLGQRIACPHCQTDIILQKPDLLKMSCFFCQEHIEFPAHAIGEKIHCPHCNMDITLKEPA
jgi:hypothetical protein